MVLTVNRTEKTIKHSPCCITDGLPCLDKGDSHITVWPRTKPTWLMVSYCSGAFPLFSPFSCISRIWSYLPDLWWCWSLIVPFYELIFKSLVGNLGLHTQIIFFVLFSRELYTSFCTEICEFLHSPWLYFFLKVELNNYNKSQNRMEIMTRIPNCGPVQRIESAHH